VYKLTVNCSPETTQEIVSLLEAEPDVSNVLVIQAVADKLRRDIITALVHREAIDIIIDQLRTLQDWQAGELSFIEVDYAVRRNLEQVETGENEDEAEDIIGWEMILELANAESRMSWWYLAFMACAGLIAAVGLVSNLPVLLLGAMSLSPDLAPTNAIAVSLTAGAWNRLFKSIRTLVLGLAVATTVAFLGALFFEFIGLHSGDLVIDETLTSFVTVVNGATIIVALTAGVAAMTAFVTSQATTAVGVAISVTTIPAAAYIGVAPASLSIPQGSAALVVLGVNIIFLTLAQVVTSVSIRAWRKRKRQRRITRN
jgi:uncharacterized hydrophobic protein (TIGR00271 family)